MSVFDDAEEFMLAMDQPVRHEPTVITDVEKWERFVMLNEEFSEHKQALAALKKANEYHSAPAIKAAMVDLADSLHDIIYIAAGTLRAYGFPANEGHRLVHQNNLNKIDPVTGLVLKKNGKVVKPEGFVEVDLRSAIYPCRH